MRIRLVNAAELSDSDLAAWRDLHDATPHASPFLHPNYTLAVSRGIDNVQVAIGEAEMPEAFVPLRRRSATRAESIGGRLTDVQGALTRRGANLNLPELLKACGLSRLRFDRVPGDQDAFSSHFSTARRCPVIALDEGFEAYRAGRRQDGSRTLEQALRKERKLIREIGPLRFALAADDEDALATLLRWKADQRQRTGTVDAFQQSWTGPYLKALRAEKNAGCEAVLSTLYAGDTLLGAHLGLRTKDLLHWWIPSYAPELKFYSPGLVFLAMTVRAAAESGLTRIDLGPGDERYKSSFMTHAYHVHRGAVDLNWLRRGWHRALDGGQSRLRTSALGEWLSKTRRRLRRQS